MIKNLDAVLRILWAGVLSYLLGGMGLFQFWVVLINPFVALALRFG